MTDGDFRYAGSIGSRKSVYLKDADKYEQELATAALDPANADTLEDGNPIPKDNSEDNVDWKKRYSDNQSHTAKQLREKDAETQRIAQENLALKQKLQEANNKPKSYPTSDEEIDQWAKQFPDFDKLLSTRIGKMIDQNSIELRNEMARLEDTSKAIAAEKGRAELLKLHPDANEIEKDPRFAVWFNEQEPEVRILIESPNPKAIAKGIKLYKEDVGIKTVQKNNSEKEASKAITLHSQPETPREKRIWRESEVDKMHPRTFAKLEKEIDQARAEGRFDYDLSSL